MSGSICTVFEGLATQIREGEEKTRVAVKVGARDSNALCSHPVNIYFQMLSDENESVEDAFFKEADVMK